MMVVFEYLNVYICVPSIHIRKKKTICLGHKCDRRSGAAIVSLCSMAHQTHIAIQFVRHQNVAFPHICYICLLELGGLGGSRCFAERDGENKHIFRWRPVRELEQRIEERLVGWSTIWHTKRCLRRCRFTYLFGQIHIFIYIYVRLRKGFYKQMELCAHHRVYMWICFLCSFEQKRICFYFHLLEYFAGMGQWRAIWLLAIYGSEIWIKEIR